MGKDSEIEWTDHTFSPWWGCEKVSPACRDCYAATTAARWRPTVKLWGPGSERQVASDRAWNQPRSWNRTAERAGVRARVFSGSMCDVFEDRPELAEPRARLARLIAETRSLDWLLLTKRPENVMRLAREALMLNSAGRLDGNVWLGTTVEDQERAEQRVPVLLSIPARVRFLSCEPLLGPVDLMDVAGESGRDGDEPGLPGLHWVIAGGESGSSARPTHPAWTRALRDQVVAAGVAFFFKQHGEWLPAADIDICDPIMATPIADPRYHALPEGGGMLRVGKAKAGRELDGRTWDEFPGGAR